jgi:hypothetical protein
MIFGKAARSNKSAAIARGLIIAAAGFNFVIQPGNIVLGKLNVGI